LQKEITLVLQTAAKIAKSRIGNLAEIIKRQSKPQATACTFTDT
jgi:hypothetical protein